MDDDDDDDYLSDAILARLEDPRPLTYTERQTKRQVQHVARQAQEMRDAEARRRVKARLAHEGEADARSRGLLTNVLEAPAVGSGTLAVRWKWRLAAVARPAMARFATGPRADG